MNITPKTRAGHSSTFLSPVTVPSWKRRGLAALRGAEFFASLYAFLLSVALIGAGFKLFGKPFAEALIKSTANPFVGLFVGVLATSLVQSSLCTTSMIVGMVAAGSLTVRNAIPMIMGANIGTTVTAILASFAVGPVGLTIALAHLLFNITGILLVYPFPRLRAVPIRLARRLGNLASESKRYAIAYVLGVFFVVPGLLILLSRIF